MGREVRRVPENWKHPQRADGMYIPLCASADVGKLQADWDEGAKQWNDGVHPMQVKYPGELGTDYSDWEGTRPDPADYMPNWPDEERTHFQMYEDTSEGTPISPVMESPETLARWLVDNEASAFAGMTADYEHWLRVARGGFAPSMVIAGGVMTSGVQAAPIQDDASKG